MRENKLPKKSTLDFQKFQTASLKSTDEGSEQINKKEGRKKGSRTQEARRKDALQSYVTATEP